MRFCFCFLLLFPGLNAWETAVAQSVSYPPFLTKSLDKITAVLDPESGRFSVRHSDGRTILFYRLGGLTSHISVKIGPRIYSNYRWIALNRTPGVVNLGRGNAEVLSDRLRYTWVIKNRDGEYAIVQDLIPGRDGDWNEVRLHVSVENRTQRETSIGISTMLDVNANGNDNVPIQIGGEIATYERPFRGAKIPAAWFMEEPTFSPDTITGRLTAEGLTVPDLFLVGGYNSHGRLGHAVYGYRANGQNFWDAGLFLQWDEALVAPNGTREVATAVGLNGPKPQRIGTFGKKFYLGRWGEEWLYLISEETATVRMSLPVDARHEKEELRDGKWDTTFVIQPYQPQHIHVRGVFHYSIVRGLDSVLWMQERMFKIESDADIGVSVASWEGYEPIMSVENGDTAFMTTGHGNAWIVVNTFEEETTVFYKPKGLPGYIANNPSFPWRTPPDTTTPIALPPRSILHLSISDKRSPLILPTDRERPDGSGSLITSDKPIGIYTQGSMSSVTGEMERWEKIGINGGMLRIDPIYPISRWGREYIVIPYRKDYEVDREEDLVRVVAAYDSTEVWFSNTPIPRTLQQGDRFDTLLDAPSVITASKPVGVLQSALWWKFMGAKDSIEAGGTMSHIPVEQWGRKYFPFVNSLRFPWADRWLITHTRESHYLRIIVHRDSADDITVNGNPISRTSMQSIGEYLYTDTQTPPEGGFFFIQSKKQFIAFSYGWSLVNTPFRPTGLYREGTIPPFKL